MIMISRNTIAPQRQRGIALMAALLILLVITILGMAMFRGYGMQQRIGGNTREKARAFHAAMAGQKYAEWYLTANNGANATAITTCAAPSTGGSLPVATSTSPLICSNIIPTTVDQPDTWGGGFQYQAPGISTATGAQGSYAQYPQFYISNLGSPNTGPAYKAPLGQNQALFQIDAAGWGGTSQTVAVVESTFIVSTISTNIPPSSSNQVQKNVFLGGP